MIKGIGIDLVEIERIKKITIDSFVKKILTENEKKIFENLKNLERKYQFLAGRFAAKEAYSKAIGTGIGYTAFKDIEVLNDSLGKPYINTQNKYIIHLSITHTDNYAMAYVVIEQ